MRTNVEWRPPSRLRRAYQPLLVVPVRLPSALLRYSHRLQAQPIEVDLFLGALMTYLEYIASEEWAARAEAAKVRAGNKCQVCNSPENLQGHHRTYERLGNELPEDITILCDTCHELFSTKTRRIGWFLDPISYIPIPFSQLLQKKLLEIGNG